MNVPVSTYRVQLNKDFTFRSLENIIDYLDRLGVTMIYASPIFKATPGSNHGYDVTDPHAINPEIGTRDDFERVSKKLREKNILWLQDIVPNHMAFNHHNHRLMDVLERGDMSEYHMYFDIDWEHPEYGKKLMVPALGHPLDKAIAAGEIKLGLSPSGIVVSYYDKVFPLSVSAYPDLVSTTFPEELRQLKEDAGKERMTGWRKAREEWFKSLHDKPDRWHHANETIDTINSTPSMLAKLLDVQHYQFTWWKQTEQSINYRRFFTINDLICLRMEDAWVFDEYHKLLREFYDNGLIHGLRIDHIDGLHDPTGYVTMLRNHFGEQCYIIAEKILESNEDMPDYWPLQGASGYQFLSYANQVFTNRQGAQKLVSFYRNLVPDLAGYDALVVEKKRMIVDRYMAGERDNLVRHVQSLNLIRSDDTSAIREAITAVMISLPVYRIYPRQIPVRGINLAVLTEAFESARKHDVSVKVLDELERRFTSPPENGKDHEKILFFLRRLMQFTGPVTAKGVEDTTFYIYNPLISHDEVGDSPDTLGISIQHFHERMKNRLDRVPLSLNATATHDTKRGEDARMRLNVLAEIPDRWISSVSEWMRMNESFKAKRAEDTAPSPNDEYFIYQSLVAGFPQDLKSTPEFEQRLTDYLVKALREAKVHSSWEEPDDFYENSCVNFINRILDDGHQFLSAFSIFMKEVLPLAYTYSLGQVLLKIAAPGIPDTYQGCELWDHSYVDPDNRRAVDYSLREELLTEISEKENDRQSLTGFLEANADKGAGKLYVLWRALNLCRNYPGVLNYGSYIPLQSSSKTPVLAFARRYQTEWIVVAVKMNRTDGDAAIVFPDDAPRQMYDHLSGRAVAIGREVGEDELFEFFPVVLLSNLL